MPRVTRQSTAHQAALLAAQEEIIPGADEAPTTAIDKTKKPVVKQASQSKKVSATSSTSKTPTANSGKKRKRTTKSKAEAKFDVNELPHGLGKVGDETEVGERNLQSVVESVPVKNENGNASAAEQDVKAVGEAAEEDENAIEAPAEEDTSFGEMKIEATKPDDPTASANGTLAKKPNVKAKREKPDPSKPKRVKKPNKYGVTLGETPYPDWSAPTPEQAHEVNKILSEVHGEVRAPKAIPLPSLTVAGCGEVPNILEALMRTLLSAHTTNKNAGTAIQGMIKRYGTLKDGHSKGNVDWNAVRLSSREEIEEAIKHGGLAKSKSRDIWKIVEMVYEENKAMREALAKNSVEDSEQSKPGAESSTEELKSKSAAVFLSDPNVLSLDYMHVMPAEEAFQKFITFPGIGVKTASCTLLFCMQRPSFAVDTHVYRLCQYLSWVPMGATRDTTFAHCDVRIPDELKYSLHQLLIAHGKICGRCRAITGESSEGWDKGCNLEHLVKRYGAKKGGEDKSPKKAGAAGKAKKVKAEDGEEYESNDIDSPGNDEEEYSPVKKAKKLAKATKPKAVAQNKAKQENATDQTAVKDDVSPTSGVRNKRGKAPTKATKKKASVVASRKRKASQADIKDVAENDSEAKAEDIVTSEQAEDVKEEASTPLDATSTSNDANEVMTSTGVDNVAEEAGNANNLPDTTKEVMADAADIENAEPSEPITKRGHKAAAPKTTVKKAAAKAKAPPKKKARMG